MLAEPQPGRGRRLILGMATAFDYVLVGILAFLAGGWAVPSGISFGLSPLGVWLASAAGSSLGLVAMTVVAGRGWDGLLRRFGVRDRSVVSPRARALIERWGDVGLAVVGTVVLGPTVTTLTAVALGIDRRRFLLWAVGATVVLNAGLAIAWSALL